MLSWQCAGNGLLDLTMSLGVWSLHLRLRERFKVGNILIAGAILMGSGTAGILVLIGFIYLVTG